jgi:hypothetical protein
MFRRPPSVVFIGAVAAVCVYALASSWIIGAINEEHGLYMFVALLVAVPVTGVRTILALRRPQEITPAPATVARVGAGPALLALTFALLWYSVPENLRLALSRDSLDDYARTVTAQECDEWSFRPRRVGLYTVTCASRPFGSHVTLEVRDRLTPRDEGGWYLAGPGDWKMGLED